MATHSFIYNIIKLDDNMLTKQIFRYLWGKKSTSSWIKEDQKGFRENNIHVEEANERQVFRAKVLKMEGVQGRGEKKAGSKWNDCLLYTSRCV